MVILHKGSCANEKRLFPVKEPPGGVDRNRRVFFRCYNFFNSENLKFTHCIIYVGAAAFCMMSHQNLGSIGIEEKFGSNQKCQFYPSQIVIILIKN